jgi:hypothetical protein
MKILILIIILVFGIFDVRAAGERETENSILKVEFYKKNNHTYMQNGYIELTNLKDLKITISEILDKNINSDWCIVYIYDNTKISQEKLKILYGILIKNKQNARVIHRNNNIPHLLIKNKKDGAYYTTTKLQKDGTGFIKADLNPPFFFPAIGKIIFQYEDGKIIIGKLKKRNTKQTGRGIDFESQLTEPEKEK